MTEEGFVDVGAYDMSQDLHTQALHGIPIARQSKVLAADDTPYGSWTVLPQSAELSATLPIRAQDMLPTAGSFFPPHFADHSGFDTTMASTVDPSWNNISSVQPDAARQWSNRVEHIVHDEQLQAYWASQMQQPQGIQMETIIPSDAMVDVGSDFTHIEPESFVEPDSFDSAGSSFPQSPQEVSFKKENTPALKHESDLEDAPPRLTRSIYVSPTGGKSVKKERRSAASSKRRSKVTKHRDRTPDWCGWGIDAKFDGVELKWDEAGDLRWCGTRTSNEKMRCEHPGCTKSFVRPEHLKRHQQTHSGDRHFRCRICAKMFNRNDNCQEHYWTHVRRPGKKDGRNQKLSLTEVEGHCTDPINGPKLIEKLRQKWQKEVELQELAG